MHDARQTQRSRQRWAVPAFGSGSTTAQSLKCLMLTIEGRSFRIAALTSLPRSTVIRVFPHRQVLVIKVNYMVIEYQYYYIIELKLTVAHDWWWSCRVAALTSPARNRVLRVSPSDFSKSGLHTRPYCSIRRSRQIVGWCVKSATRQPANMNAIRCAC